MALISNGTTVASGGSVSYNRLTDTPTIPTNTNQLTNGAGYITSAPAPTSSQVASATAGISAGSVGSYALIYRDSWSNSNEGTTFADSMQFSNCQATTNSRTPSGTWRLMGLFKTGGSTSNTCVMLRIS